MQLFSKHKNAEIHVFKRFRRFFILLIICAKTNSPPQIPFKKATSDSEDAMFTKAYLAHIYYDLKEFNHCLDMIEQIPDNYFSKLFSHQNWRDLKIQELKICCLIKLKIFSDFEFILHSYFLKISRSSEHDIPVPIELSNIMKNIK